MVGWHHRRNKEVARLFGRRVQSGCWLGGIPSYGYKAIRCANGRLNLTINPNDAKVVRRAFQSALQHGPYSYRVTRILNDEGYVTRQGRPWPLTRR